ncbi:MAG: hypothetical protein E5Y30_00125 [Mesorhizobium sp.]|nr:MAG: hypothetical protein E5Y30_00125 [Mesorhizobium sp.]
MSADLAFCPRILFRQMGRPPCEADEPDWPQDGERAEAQGSLLRQEYRETHPDGHGYHLVFPVLKERRVSVSLMASGGAARAVPTRASPFKSSSAGFGLAVSNLKTDS